MENEDYDMRHLSPKVVAELFWDFGHHWMEVTMADVDRKLENPGEGHDSHTEMVNVVAFAMHKAGFTSFAVRLYERAIDRTLAFREERNEWRHAGALMTNLGVMHAFLGDFDRAVIAFFKAAEEDKRTHNKERGETFVFKELWHKGIREPLLEVIFPFLQSVESTATYEEMDAGLAAMGVYDFAFVAYARSLMNHLRMEKSLSNDFSDLRIVSALRDLCALLEIRLKHVAGGGDTFHPAVKELYKADPGKLAAFDAARRSVGAVHNSTRPNADQVRQALTTLPEGTKEERFRKSLVVSYSVRNYVIHQMDLGGPLLDHATAKAILGHLLNVFSYLEAERTP
jgi:tetratricopeptide (TPR) repeat protein